MKLYFRQFDLHNSIYIGDKIVHLQTDELNARFQICANFVGKMGTNNRGFIQEPWDVAKCIRSFLTQVPNPTYVSNFFYHILKSAASTYDPTISNLVTSYTQSFPYLANYLF